MDSTLIDIERGRERDRDTHSLPSYREGKGRAGESWQGGVGRYICKMDYVGFAEFNIDTDSS